MALVKATLEAELLDFFAAPPVVMAGSNVDYTASRSACAQKWADAMQKYLSSAGSVLTPASTTITTALATFKTSLASAFATTGAAAAVDTAFVALATSLGTGMAPAFVATPPAGNPGFASNITTNEASHALAAASWAARIDAWLRTGTATPTGGGSAVPWA